MGKEYCLLVFPELHPTKVIIIGAGIEGICCKGSISLGASVKVLITVLSFKGLQNNIGHRLWTSVIRAPHGYPNN